MVRVYDLIKDKSEMEKKKEFTENIYIFSEHSFIL